MKLTNKVALISGLGCLALVGSGFAAWTYSETITDGSATNAVVATAKQTNGGTITVDTKLGGIKLDELYAADGKTPILSAGNKIQGVATWDPAFDVSAHFEISADHGSIAYTDYNYTYTMVVPANVAKYVTVTDTNTTVGHWDRTDNSVFTFKTPTLAFVQANAPQNPTDYATMVSDLSGQVITITFSVSYKY